MKAQVWTKQATVKILADKKYDNSFRKKELVFEAAKNEYESAQIIITALQDIKEYSLALSCLRAKNDEIFPAECFKIYNQKYIEIKKHSTYRSHYQLGMYPDALLPIEVAEAYGENFVKSGSNQGIWITAEIGKDQKAGEYSGEFILTLDDEVHKIVVKLTVWDFEVSSEVHAKSDFVIGSNGLMHGENNSFPEMYRRYVERLIDFRLSPHRIIQFLNRPFVEPIDFITELRYLTQQGKKDLSTIMLPVYPNDSGIDEDYYNLFIDAIADACIEDGINYFDKAAVYCGFIDEPHLNNTYQKTNLVCKQYEQLKYEAAERFLSKDNIMPFRQAVAESMRKVGNFVTTHFDERLTEIKNWCPAFWRFHTAESREAYARASDNNWWYGCGSSNKAPSYAIDHKLIDSRILSWMQKDYNLGGTLYWETVMYYKWVWHPETHYNHEVKIDCYKEACRCAQDNGDGFLFYPGEPYGINGPVDSIRLHAIRDGLEEYEYLWLYEQLCSKKGLDPRVFLDEIYNQMYNGTIVLADADMFDEVRRKLANEIVRLLKGQ